MITRLVAMEAKHSVAAGAAVDVSTYGRKTFFVNAGAAATVQIEITPDADPTSATWYAVGSPVVNTKAIVSTDEGAKWARANTTAFASGVPACRLAGIYSSGAVGA